METLYLQVDRRPRVSAAPMMQDIHFMSSCAAPTSAQVGTLAGQPPCYQCRLANAGQACACWWHSACRGHARDAASSHALVVWFHRVGFGGRVQQRVGNASGGVARAAGLLRVAALHPLLSPGELALELVLECNCLGGLCSQRGCVTAPGLLHAEWHALRAAKPQQQCLSYK